MVDSILFTFFTAAALLGALGVLFMPNILYAALSLLVVFGSIAGFFLLNNADFLAIAQLLVYGVGLTIVILFGLMFTANQPLPAVAGQQVRRWLSAGLFLAVATVLITVVANLSGAFPLRQASTGWIDQLQAVGTTPAIGKLLMTKYLLPFELASLLLLGAMVGAIVLARRSMEEAVETGIKYTSRGVLPEEAKNWRQDVGLMERRRQTPDVDAALRSSESSSPVEARSGALES